jgi:hypothetical protein
MQETSDLSPSLNDLYAEMDSLINHGDPYGNRETRGRLYGLSVEIEEAGDQEVAREIREELSATADRAEVTMIEVESGDTTTFISAERHAANLAAANFGPAPLADEVTEQFVEANTPTLLAVPGETNRARRRRLEAKRIEGLKAESLARHIEAYQAAAGGDQ